MLYKLESPSLSLDTCPQCLLDHVFSSSSFLHLLAQVLVLFDLSSILCSLVQQCGILEYISSNPALLLKCKSKF